METKRLYQWPPGRVLFLLTGFLLWLSTGNSLNAQQIVRMEYFFNQDPGPGNATALAITSGPQLDSLHFSISIDTLDEGFHHLFLRAKDDSGRWSITTARGFFKMCLDTQPPQLTKMEYFINQDPGRGNGTDIPLPSPGAFHSLALDINLQSLNEGFHRLFIRSRDALGRWSITHTRTFYRMHLPDTLPGLLGGEFFFHQDPGFGQGTPFNLNGQAHLSYGLNLDITHLPDGFHTLMFRLKDQAGNWSQTQVRSFYKQYLPDTLVDIVYLEYAIDTMPAPGQATPLPLPADSQVVALAHLIELDSLTEGFHTLFFRARDARGHWSLVNTRPFYKQQMHFPPSNIIAAEYFLDTDPGEGAATPVPLPAGPEVPFLAWQLDLDSVSFGEHFLFVRTKDEHGKWSITQRDTIFYYIDTLPTASLSGPVNVCIGDTATFTVNLSGSAPWSIIVDNGLGIDTLHGILQSPFYFEVPAPQAGTFTARVLQVSDIYYTGLYTGIPIQYQVKPLPEPAGSISGLQSICASHPVTTYSIARIANAAAYHWSVPSGASILSSGTNWYSGRPWVTVDFHGVAQQGFIRVHASNACGTGSEASLEVRVFENPIANAGSDQVIDFGDTAYLNGIATGGTPPYVYAWSPWWAFEDHTLADPVFTYTATLSLGFTVTDSNGCQGSDALTVYVGPQAGATISGTLRYDNAASSPLRNSSVSLWKDTLVQTAQTSQGGAFSFAEVSTGQYQLRAQTSLPWGGVNATDALLILKHFVDSVSLQQLRLGAADVTGSGYANAVDALMVARRFTGAIDSFPAGDWLFSEQAFYTLGIGQGQYHLRGICLGDVDASYDPAKQARSGVRLEVSGSIDSKGMQTTLPFRAGSAMELGAASLVIAVPAGYQVEEVRPANEEGSFLWHILDNELRIAWFGLEAWKLEAGAPLFHIFASHTLLPQTSWQMKGGSSLAGPDGNELSDAILWIPEVHKAPKSFVLGEAYPNPAREHTEIRYHLSAESNVALSLLDLQGRELRTLFQGSQEAGDHLIQLPLHGLSSGLYLYRLRGSTATYQFEESKRLIVIRP
jgi:hypothetical protein